MAEPKRFADYQLLRRVTQSPTGNVYLARHEDDPFGEPVALRRIYPDVAAQVVRDVLEEAIFAAQLNHPNMVTVREMGETEGMLYFAIDYVHGASLRALVAGWRVVEPTRPFPWAPLCRAALSLCEALEYCHTLVDAAGKPSGMVHQGLSPRSVMIGTNGAVKLVDFGRARNLLRALAEPSSPGNSLPAQPEFAAPEQILGKPVDARTDVYGLALMLYTALTGIQPFVAPGGPDSVALAVLRREVPQLRDRRPDVPRAMREAIHDALSRDPPRRPQTMADRDRLWDALFDERQVVGLPELGKLVNQVFSLIDG